MHQITNKFSTNKKVHHFPNKFSTDKKSSTNKKIAPIPNKSSTNFLFSNHITEYEQKRIGVIASSCVLLHDISVEANRVKWGEPGEEEPSKFMEEKVRISGLPTEMTWHQPEEGIAAASTTSCLVARSWW